MRFILLRAPVLFAFIAALLWSGPASAAAANAAAARHGGGHLQRRSDVHLLGSYPEKLYNAFRFSVDSKLFIAVLAEAAGMGTAECAARRLETTMTR
jgi:hypothetical protein